MGKWIKLNIFFNNVLYIKILLWYTNGYKDEVSAVRTFIPPMAFRRDQYTIRHFWKTPITKKHPKTTKTNQKFPKFNTHLRLVIAFQPLQSELQWNFFEGVRKKSDTVGMNKQKHWFTFFLSKFQFLNFKYSFLPVFWISLIVRGSPDINLMLLPGLVTSTQVPHRQLVSAR